MVVVGGVVVASESLMCGCCSECACGRACRQFSACVDIKENPLLASEEASVCGQAYPMLILASRVHHPSLELHRWSRAGRQAGGSKVCMGFVLGRGTWGWRLTGVFTARGGVRPAGLSRCLFRGSAREDAQRVCWHLLRQIVCWQTRQLEPGLCPCQLLQFANGQSTQATHE